MTYPPSLSSALIARISAIAAQLREVDPKSEDEWIEGFAMDWMPRREIEIWEVMALAYSSFIQTRTLCLQAKQEVLGLALSMSFGRTAAEVHNKATSFLTARDRREFPDHFTAASRMLGKLDALARPIELLKPESEQPERPSTEPKRAEPKADQERRILDATNRAQAGSSKALLAGEVEATSSNTSNEQDSEVKPAAPKPNNADFWHGTSVRERTPSQDREAMKRLPRIEPVDREKDMPLDKPTNGRNDWADRMGAAVLGIRRHLRIAAAVAALACTVGIVYGTWYMATPHNYPDCLLKNLRSSKTNAQTFLIRDACRAKFPREALDRFLDR